MGCPDLGAFWSENKQRVGEALVSTSSPNRLANSRTDVVLDNRAEYAVKNSK